MGWLSKIVKALGKLTDILVKGRQAGLWSEGNRVDPKGKPHDPSFPDTRLK